MAKLEASERVMPREYFFEKSGHYLDNFKWCNMILRTFFFLTFFQQAEIFLFLCLHLLYILGFPSSSDSKEMPAIEETLVPSLGQEDSLEKGMSTHSSILA